MDGTVSIGKPMKNVTLVAALAASFAFSANAMAIAVDLGMLADPDIDA